MITPAKEAPVVGDDNFKEPRTRDWIERFLKMEAFMVNSGTLWTLLLFIACMDIIGFLAGVFDVLAANQQHIITIPFLEKTLPVAKGAGRVISINAALLLLTGCKATITWLRSTFVSCLLPVDKLMPFLHIRLYLIIAFCAALHATTQYVNYITGSFPWVFGLWTFHFPDPTVQLLITGTLLVILMTAIAITAGPWIRRSVNRGYNIFWTVHIFGFTCVYPLLILHGVLLGTPDTWKYILGPLVIYVIDLLYRSRAISFKGLSVVCWLNPSSEGVTELVMKRPFAYKAGQYVQIRLPIVSRWEYHPISIASAPHEEYLRIFIKSSGDWSSLVYKVAEDLQRDSFAFSDATSNVDARGVTIVNVRGPFGAPTEHVKDFSKVILVGTGIGATPFSSVIREYLHTCSKADQCNGGSYETVLHLSQLDRPSHAILFDSAKERSPSSPRKVETLLPSFFMNMTKLAYRGIVDPFLVFMRTTSVDNKKTASLSPKKEKACICASLGFFHSLSLNFIVLWIMMIAGSIRVAFVLFGYHGQYSSAIWGLLVSVLILFVFGFSLFIAIRSLSWKYLKTVIGVLDLLAFLIGLALFICVFVCIASWGTENVWTIEKVLNYLTFYCLIPVVGFRALLLIISGCGVFKWKKSKHAKAKHAPSKSLHFIWVNRTVHGFHWFFRDFERIVSEDSPVDVQIDIFVTGVVNELSLPENSSKIRYHIGRPQWSQLFSNIFEREDFIRDPEAVGVFFCGSPAVGRIVKAAANEASLEAAKKQHVRGNRCFPKIIFHKEYF
jgi:respiratory burst oxidase